jgi:phosphoglycolate phosphatase-like HAD superfamily hydrolase
LNCNEILFVGDSIFDVETAKAAGMNSVAVSWGFSSKTDLSVYKPDYIVDNPLEILDILKKERAL